MTETSPAPCWRSIATTRLRKAGSAGKPLMHTDVRVVGPDGNDVPVGEMGELWVKGPNVTPGYWNRPDANGGVVHRRLAAHRRRGPRRRGRLLLYRRPLEGHVHFRRRERLSGRSGECAVSDPRCRRSGGDRHRRRAPGRDGFGDRRVEAGRERGRSGDPGRTAAPISRGSSARAEIRFIYALPRNATGKVHKPTLRKEFGVSGAPSAAVPSAAAG